MIRELLLFGMGFLFASILRIIKVAIITESMRKRLMKDTAEAQKMQKEFYEKGESKELMNRQIASVSTLGKHMGAQEILSKFNYIIW